MIQILKYVGAMLFLLNTANSYALDSWSWEGVAFFDSKPAGVQEVFGNPASDAYRVYSYEFDQINRPFAGIRVNYSEVAFHFTNSGSADNTYYLYRIDFKYDNGFPFWDVQHLAASLTKKWFGKDAIIDQNDEKAFSARPKLAPVAATSIRMGGEHGGSGGLSITVTECGRADASNSGFN